MTVRFPMLGALGVSESSREMTQDLQSLLGQETSDSANLEWLFLEFQPVETILPSADLHNWVGKCDL